MKMLCDINELETPLDINRRTVLTAAAAIVIAASGTIAGAVTAALYSDSATSTGNSFEAGTVTVRLTDANETSLASVAASIGTDAMAPGDTTTGYIEVKNTGTLAQRYAITTTDTTAPGAANTAISAALTAGIDSRAATTACTAAQGGAGQTEVKAAGTTLQTLAVGNRVAGADAGDRALAAGAEERLCFYVTLPSTVGNATQGGTASYAVTFNAEQTKNN